MAIDAATLGDIHEIEQAIIAIARAMDDHDWNAILAILADDAVADMGSGRLENPGAIIDIMRHYLERCGTTQHLIGNIVVTVNGDQATSLAYVHDSHLPPGDAPGAIFYTLGDYHDRWERQGGRWRMVERLKRNRASVGSLRDVFGL